MSDDLKELKPCPFCGSEDVKIAAHPGAGTGYWHHGDTVYSIDCLGCTASFASRYKRELLVEQWNRRSIASVKREPLTEMDIWNIYCKAHKQKTRGWEYFARAIEQAHGIHGGENDHDGPESSASAENAVVPKVGVSISADQFFEPAQRPYVDAPTIPKGMILVPEEPTEAMLRPFHDCPPDELPLAYLGMIWIAAMQFKRPPTIEQFLTVNKDTSAAGGNHK